MSCQSLSFIIVYNLCVLKPPTDCRILKRITDWTRTNRSFSLISLSRRLQDQLFLPTHMSLRGCYASYLQRLGYNITYYNDGNYSVGEWKSPNEDNDADAVAPPYVSLNCFYSVWQRDFGHIKVSKPSEDICNLCVAFANRHKYQLASEQANSSADGELFIQQTDHLTEFLG